MKPQTVFIQLVALVVFLVIISTCADTSLSTDGQEKNLAVDSSSADAATTQVKSTSSAAPSIEKIAMRAVAGSTSSSPAQSSSESGASVAAPSEGTSRQPIEDRIREAQRETESNLKEILGESDEKESDMSVEEFSERADSLYEKQKSILNDILEDS
jgi:hypothetical protein